MGARDHGLGCWDGSSWITMGHLCDTFWSRVTTQLTSEQHKFMWKDFGDVTGMARSWEVSAWISRTGNVGNQTALSYTRLALTLTAVCLTLAAWTAWEAMHCSGQGPCGWLCGALGNWVLSYTVCQKCDSSRLGLPRAVLQSAGRRGPTVRRGCLLIRWTVWSWCCEITGYPRQVYPIWLLHITYCTNTQKNANYRYKTKPVHSRSHRCEVNWDPM